MNGTSITFGMETIDAPRQHPSERKALRCTLQMPQVTSATFRLLRHSEVWTRNFFTFAHTTSPCGAKVKKKSIPLTPSRTHRSDRRKRNFFYFTRAWHCARKVKTSRQHPFSTIATSTIHPRKKMFLSWRARFSLMMAKGNMVADIRNDWQTKEDGGHVHIFVLMLIKWNNRGSMTGGHMAFEVDIWIGGDVAWHFLYLKARLIHMKNAWRFFFFDMKWHWQIYMARHFNVATKSYSAMVQTTKQRTMEER